MPCHQDTAPRGEDATLLSNHTFHRAAPPNWKNRLASKTYQIIVGTSARSEKTIPTVPADAGTSVSAPMARPAKPVALPNTLLRSMTVDTIIANSAPMKYATLNAVPVQLAMIACPAPSSAVRAAPVDASAYWWLSESIEKAGFAAI